MTDPNNSAVICVIDRLGAAWLGPYGNTWIETPAFNQLATDCVLFEHAVADSPDLSRLYRSYWTGRHAICEDAAGSRNTIGDLTSRGVDTMLVTDEPLLAGHPLSEAFAGRVEVTARTSNEPAGTLLETGLANLFSAALATLRELTPPFLLWVHSRGMGAPWDAPYELREAFAVEDDPQPPDFTAVPSHELPEDYDPDELLGIVHAYAGQVVSLDECLAGLLAAIAEHNDMPLLTLLTSPRGFPLGEHRVVGDAVPLLFSETLHVPYLLRRPVGNDGLNRVRRFLQPADISATLTDWFQVPAESANGLARSSLRVAAGTTGRLDDRACAAQGGQRVFRTPAWQLWLPATAGQDIGGFEWDAKQPELFAKPDDRFEANNVAERCPGIVQAMHDAKLEFESAAASSDIQRLSDLPEVLIQGLD